MPLTIVVGKFSNGRREMDTLVTVQVEQVKFELVRSNQTLLFSCSLKEGKRRGERTILFHKYISSCSSQFVAVCSMTECIYLFFPSFPVVVALASF